MNQRVGQMPSRSGLSSEEMAGMRRRYAEEGFWPTARVSDVSA
jgi:hypothetical protein